MTNLLKLTPENTTIMTQAQLDKFLQEKFPDDDCIPNEVRAFRFFAEHPFDIHKDYIDVFNRNSMNDSPLAYADNYPREVIVINSRKLGLPDSYRKYFFIGAVNRETGKAVDMTDGTWYMCRCAARGKTVITQIIPPADNEDFVPFSGDSNTCACRHCAASHQAGGYCEGCDRTLCDCYREHIFDEDDFRRELDDYGHTEARGFDEVDNRKSVLHMGAELEVDCEHIPTDYKDLIEAVKQIRSETSAVCKHDGSLRYGFENATQPRTAENLKNELWHIAKTCLDAGVDEHGANHAGLHFHMDMQYLTGRDSYTSLRDRYTKITAFVLVEALYQDERMYELDDRGDIRDEYGDNPRQYCRTKSNESTHKIKDKGMKYMGLMEQESGDRYSAVNCTCCDTIELRFFNGTLKEDYLKMAVDVAAAIAYLIRTLDIDNVLSFSFQKFVTFIAKNRKTYPDAYAYMKSHKLLKPRKK